MEKILYLIAGANGSGKTTLASELLPAEDLDFLNADEIAKELSPYDLGRARLSAGKELFRRLNKMLEGEKSFVIETTLSGTNHIKTIKMAKAKGYRTALIFLFLETPQQCIDRINIRVLKGGHFVPDAEVIRRFYRGISNFYNIYKEIVDGWTIYYHGTDDYIPIAAGAGNNIDVLNETIYNDFRNKQGAAYES